MADDTIQTTRKLKVFGGNLSGQWRAIMACRSFAEFTRATRITRDYGAETSNQEEIAQAMSSPGTLFVRSSSVWTVKERADV